MPRRQTGVRDKRRGGETKVEERDMGAPFMLVRSFGGNRQVLGRLEALGSLPCWSESCHKDYVYSVNGWCNGQMLPKHEQ